MIIPKKSEKFEEAQSKKELLIKMYKEGDSICKISKETGIHRGRIAKILQEAGIKEISKRKDIDKEFQDNKNKYKDIIIEMYNNGICITKIKEKLKEEYNFNTSYHTIGKILKENGVAIKQAKDYTKHYSCDSKVFSSYDKYSYYWAGLLAADGCVYQRKDIDGRYIILALKDKETVIRFKGYIKYTGEVTERSVGGNSKLGIKPGKVWEVRCYSNEICDNLKTNFNITPQKTYTYTPPETIPYELIKYFILGYFDGDGCISYSVTSTGRKQFCFSVTGTYETIHYIQNYLGKNELKLVERHPEHHVNNVSLGISGNDQLLDILDNFYSDDDINHICMERKYEKYLILKEQQERKYRLASE